MLLGKRLFSVLQYPTCFGCALDDEILVVVEDGLNCQYVLGVRFQLDVVMWWLLFERREKWY